MTAVTYAKTAYRVKVETPHGEVELLTRRKVRKGKKVKIKVDREKVIILKA